MVNTIISNTCMHFCPFYEKFRLGLIANNMSKVTILIPTYNQSKYLPQAIESALAQDYPDIEVLVIDDGSVDDTQNIIDRYKSDPRFRYFRNPINLGRVGNYQHGLFDCAGGDYVLNLDGDDWLSDNQYISDAVKLLDQHPEVGFVMAETDVFSEKEGLRYSKGNRHQKLGIIDGMEYINDLCFNRVVFAHLAAVFRRDVAISLNFYNIDSTWTDGISFIRMACKYKVALVSRSVGVWRLHDKNESRKFFEQTSPKDIFRDLFLVVGECNFLSKDAIDSCLYRDTYSYFAWAAKSGRISKIIEMSRYLHVYYPEFLFRNAFRLMRELIFGLLLFIPKRLRSHW